MKDTTKKILTGILALILFAGCTALVIIGQRNIGPRGLLIQLLGLAGLVLLLWVYNRKYR